MCPIGWAQIHTSVHAGGIASEAIRARTSSSSTRRPSSSTYSKPLPRRRRRIPGESGSERLNFGTAARIPVEVPRESPSRSGRAVGMCPLPHPWPPCSWTDAPADPPAGLALRGRLLLRRGLRAGAVGVLGRGALLGLRVLGLAVAVPGVRARAADRGEARLERGH